METALYYTYSTIAQTIAGAIGLLGAFLIYHLSETRRSLYEYLEKLYSYYPRGQGTEDLDFMWEHKDIDGLIEYFHEDKLRQLEVGDCLAQPMYLVPAEGLHDHRKLLFKKTKIALILTCVTVILSLFILPIVPFLVGWVCRTILVSILIVGPILGSICIYLYAKIVVTIFRK